MGKRDKIKGQFRILQRVEAHVAVISKKFKGGSLTAFYCIRSISNKLRPRLVRETALQNLETLVGQAKLWTIAKRRETTNTPDLRRTLLLLDHCGCHGGNYNVLMLS